MPAGEAGSASKGIRSSCEGESQMIKWILVLWPSFLVAGVAVSLFFTLINPRELYLFGEVVEFSAIATYSIGFFGFWLLCASSSLLTLYLVGRPSAERSRSAPSGPRMKPRAKPLRAPREHVHHHHVHG